MSAFKVLYPFGLVCWQLAVVTYQNFDELFGKLLRSVSSSRALFLLPDGEIHGVVVDGNGGILVLASPEVA